MIFVPSAGRLQETECAKAAGIRIRQVGRKVWRYSRLIQVSRFRMRSHREWQANRDMQGRGRYSRASSLTQEANNRPIQQCNRAMGQAGSHTQGSHREWQDNRDMQDRGSQASRLTWVSRPTWGSHPIRGSIRHIHQQCRLYVLLKRVIIKMQYFCLSFWDLYWLPWWR